jgi:hypothetical protein
MQIIGMPKYLSAALQKSAIPAYCFRTESAKSRRVMTHKALSLLAEPIHISHFHSTISKRYVSESRAKHLQITKVFPNHYPDSVKAIRLRMKLRARMKLRPPQNLTPIVSLVYPERRWIKERIHHTQRPNLNRVTEISMLAQSVTKRKPDIRQSNEKENARRREVHKRDGGFSSIK